MMFVVKVALLATFIQPVFIFAMSFVRVLAFVGEWAGLDSSWIPLASASNLIEPDRYSLLLRLGLWLLVHCHPSDRIHCRLFIKSPSDTRIRIQAKRLCVLSTPPLVDHFKPRCSKPVLEVVLR